jgi:hypothetical protein
MAQRSKELARKTLGNFSHGFCTMKDMKSMKFGKHAIASFPPFMLFMPFMVKISGSAHSRARHPEHRTPRKLQETNNRKSFPSWKSPRFSILG